MPNNLIPYRENYIQNVPFCIRCKLKPEQTTITETISAIRQSGQKTLQRGRG